MSQVVAIHSQVKAAPESRPSNESKILGHQLEQLGDDVHAGQAAQGYNMAVVIFASTEHPGVQVRQLTSFGIENQQLEDRVLAALTRAQVRMATQME